MTRTLVGYADRFSVHAGERLRFMVSSFGPAGYRAALVRLLGDDGKERVIENAVNGDYPARRQEIHSGSYAIVPEAKPLSGLESFTVALYLWPTTPSRGRQALLAKGDPARGRGFALTLGTDGTVQLEIADGAGGKASVGSGRALQPRHWYWVAASFDAASGRVTILQQPIRNFARAEDAATVNATVRLAGCGAANREPLTMAAFLARAEDDRLKPVARYNGKLEAPRLLDLALDAEGLARLRADSFDASLRPHLVGAWDFSKEIASTRIRDLSPWRLDGRVENLPTRAMKGHNWDGTARDWTTRPEFYGAIHFHENDLYDAGWEADFDLALPANLPSGVYAMRLTAGEEVERVPFFVRPARGGKAADLLFLVPTASYMAYANEHMCWDAQLGEQGSGHVAAVGPEEMFLNEHREYGYSFYDTHEDGSGVSISSRLRPILNMRPGHSAGWVGAAGLSPWQFAADLDLIEWLEATGQRYDVATDEDLHREGIALLRSYRTVMTGTHPEYYSTRMHDALGAWLDRGGRLMYLGANGFYWHIAFHPELEGAIELRRVENGVRDWEGEPGEYVENFSGEYGGLWRRWGRPPQSIVGIGFIAQGFDVSSYFRRQPGSFDPRAAFIFEGVGAEEKIGDFGRVGGGAAGWELDIVDSRLGSPPHTLVLAASENHSNVYVVVPEEVLSTLPALSGIDNPLVRGEMAFFETPQGGAVFSTGSISWCGSLNHAKGLNNVARITGNVLKRFLDPAPF
jgi:N,N-dimethylformamidase